MDVTTNFEFSETAGATNSNYLKDWCDISIKKEVSEQPQKYVLKDDLYAISAEVKVLEIMLKDVGKSGMIDLLGKKTSRTAAENLILCKLGYRSTVPYTVQTSAGATNVWPTKGPYSFKRVQSFINIKSTKKAEKD